MIKLHVGVDIDEFNRDRFFDSYDTSKLLVEGTDQPFFPSRLFSARLVKLAEDLKSNARLNKIFIFKGPPGSGKSIFLSNLLKKFEEFSSTEDGRRYETVWRLNPNMNFPLEEQSTNDLSHIVNKSSNVPDGFNSSCQYKFSSHNYIDIPCPSHDNPILIIPKNSRRQFFDELFTNDEFKSKLFTDKEYEWVFKDEPCTICDSIYRVQLNRLKSPLKVFEHIFARPYYVNRKLSQGISVYGPGDKPMGKDIITNPMFQNKIDRLLEDSNLVKFIYSHYACINDGVYALMDIKAYNRERFIELHNIISEGLHKIENTEENTKSLFFILMNPEDEDVIKASQSFLDRVEYIDIPYVIDIVTEVEIYRNIFGMHIDNCFLPRVLHNFARVIISSRLNQKSYAMTEWIGDPNKYREYCDENFLLLKMEIYTGYIPNWLSEEDRKRLTDKRRKNIIAESVTEGEHGISGRDSIKIFNDFYSSYSKDNKLINMSQLCNFFTKSRKELSEMIPGGFLDSLLRMYDYTILKEVKESLYYYNEEQISRDIQNYLFAVNFESGSVATCAYTGERLEISDEFFENLERRFLGSKADNDERRRFRSDTQREYTSKSLTQEMMLEGKPLTATRIYSSLHQRYVYNLKEKVLDPSLRNDNFFNAIKDYNEVNFKIYDKRIRDDVNYLISNLCNKFRYTELGAKEVCLYVIDLYRTKIIC
jgi:predicted Ser/Thr protein kinase